MTEAPLGGRPNGPQRGPNLPRTPGSVPDIRPAGTPARIPLPDRLGNTQVGSNAPDRPGRQPLPPNLDLRRAATGTPAEGPTEDLDKTLDLTPKPAQGPRFEPDETTLNLAKYRGGRHSSDALRESAAASDSSSEQAETSTEGDIDAARRAEGAQRVEDLQRDEAMVAAAARRLDAFSQRVGQTVQAHGGQFLPKVGEQMLQHLRVESPRESTFRPLGDTTTGTTRPRTHVESLSAGIGSTSHVMVAETPEGIGFARITTIYEKVTGDLTPPEELGAMTTIFEAPQDPAAPLIVRVHGRQESPLMEVRGTLDPRGVSVFQLKRPHRLTRHPVETYRQVPTAAIPPAGPNFIENFFEVAVKSGSQEKYEWPH